MTGIATGLTASISNLQLEVGNIKQQAERIAGLGEKYQKTEELTSAIHSILIGSYSKGRTGEQVLRNTMAEFMRMGLVEANVPFGTKVVEYGVKFQDGKYLAIDSKVVATGLLEKLHGDDTSVEEKDKVALEIKGKLRNKIEEVALYIDPQRTLPYAIMAIPDSLLQFAPELMPEASRRNVFVAGYSTIPPLLGYFVKVYSSHMAEQDIRILVQNINQVHRSLSKFSDDYFSNRLEKPLSTIQKAVGEIKSGVTKASESSNLETMIPGQSNSESREQVAQTLSEHDEKI